jgi:hypothetical protein
MRRESGLVTIEVLKVEMKGCEMENREGALALLYHSNPCLT